MVRRVAVFGLALAAIGLLPETSASQTRSATESTLHAAFTFNFAKFTQWPDSRAQAGPLTFCVLNDEVVEDALEELIRGSSIRGREVAIVRGIDREQIPLCHVLYLPDIAAVGPDFLADALGASALIVGDGREFAQRGGHRAVRRGWAYAVRSQPCPGEARRLDFEFADVEPRNDRWR